MLKNYLTVTIRNLKNQRFYTFINVAGLAVGMACGLLILLFVQDERSYDQFHTNADRLYRLNKLVTPTEGETEHTAITSGLMGPTMVTTYPEVEAAVRVLPWFDAVLTQRGETRINMEDVVFADSNFFQVFDFTLLQGDPSTVLQAPSSIVLTETMAQIFFGESNPIGQTLTGLNDLTYTVTGISADPPINSHLTYNALVSWSTTVPGQGPLNFAWMNRWITQVNYTYILLTPSTDVPGLEAKFGDFMQSFFPQRAGQYHLYLQPFNDLYLGSSDLLYTRGLRQGNATYVIAFSAIAVLLIVIACINFMNLTTARATKRAKEVGVRKVLGAYRSDLARQFLGEAILLSLLALSVALLLTEAALPFFNNFTGKRLALGLVRTPSLLMVLVVLALILGTLSGLYPALFLSSFRPASVLKGGWKGSTKSGELPRKVLVTFQFAITIALLVGTAVVFRQMDFIQTKNLGYQDDQVVVLPSVNQPEAFKEALLQNTTIQHVTSSGSVPGLGTMSFSIRADGKAETESWTAHIYPVDYDYLETYQMKMVEGRFFSEAFATDATEAMIINETMVRSLGWDDPIGRRLDVPGERETGVVIGVIEDFHNLSLHQAVDPMVLYVEPRRLNILSVKVQAAAIPEALAHMEAVSQTIMPETPFRYYFLDEAFAQQYATEQRTMETLGLFSILTIFIACLGLFGLATFTAEQRTKEIGVRKVMGATVPTLVLLLTKDFARLVVIALVLAAPVAYLLMSRWLEAFVYRIDIGLGVFIIAGATALALALFTVSYQSIRAALGDPVKALRYE